MVNGPSQSIHLTYSIVGSIPTPYIFDDRCRWEDAAERITEVYNLSKEERQERGLEGYKWAISDEAGFTSQHQAQSLYNVY
jgi:hypothetical protein